MQEFVEEWVTGLDHDDKKALAMLLCFTLVTEDAFTETAAAQTAAKIIGKSDRTVLQWRSEHSLKVFKVITKEVEFCGVMKS